MPSKNAIDKFKKFTGREVAKISSAKILLPDEKSDVAFFGKCPEVTYLSDKWDQKKTRPFVHHLKKHGDWLAVFDKDGRIKTLIVTGVNLSMKDVGLTG